MRKWISGTLRVDALLAFLFGTIFIVVLLVLAVVIRDISKIQAQIFRVVLALAAAGVAAVIPGFLNINVAGGKRFRVRAAGALGVFVLVYLFNPAQLQP